MERERSLTGGNTDESTRAILEVMCVRLGQEEAT